MSRIIRGCTGKKRISGLSIALRVRDKMKEKYGHTQPGRRFDCYQCWCCGFWHVGTEPVGPEPGGKSIGTNQQNKKTKDR